MKELDEYGLYRKNGHVLLVRILDLHHPDEYPEFVAVCPELDALMRNAPYEKGMPYVTMALETVKPYVEILEEKGLMDRDKMVDMLKWEGLYQENRNEN